MFIVLGSSGYVGSKICEYLEFQNMKYIPMSFRHQPDKIKKLNDYVSSYPIQGLINCAAYTGIKSIDDCELDRQYTFDANVECVKDIISIASIKDLPVVHVSTGCIYNGDNMWTESDPPFFSSSVYNASKIEAEYVASQYTKSYICRLRLPFDFKDHPKNLLSKLSRFTKITDNVNSLTNINDFALIVIELLKQKKSYGIYNVVNPGKISFNYIKTLLRKYGKGCAEWEVMSKLEEEQVFKNLKSNTTLSSTKVEKSGFILDDVDTSIIKCLDNWNQTENVFW